MFLNSRQPRPTRKTVTPVSSELERARKCLTENDLKVLRAIAQGYPIKTEQDRFIVVENPDFTEDGGEDPYLVMSIWRLQGFDDLGEVKKETEDA